MSVAREDGMSTGTVGYIGVDMVQAGAWSVCQVTVSADPVHGYVYVEGFGRDLRMLPDQAQMLSLILKTASQQAQYRQ